MTTTSGNNSSEPWTDRVWLQKVLQDLEGDPSLSIIDHQVKDSSSKGDHFLSEMYRITAKIRVGNKEKEMFMIAKTLPSGADINKTLTESTAFPNEIRVFKHILPQYQSILDTAAPGKFKPFAARHIYSHNSVPYYLIVSDLAPEGFRMSKRQDGLDLEHCLVVMKTLGRYHAASVALQMRDPELVKSFKENAFIEESSVGWVQKIAEASVSSVAKMVRTWPNGGQEMASRLLESSKTFSQKFQQMYGLQGNRLNVLLHGDVWVNNLLFKYNDVSGKVEDMRMVDFQLACYTSCAIDLQYFMHTSPKDEVRASHTEDLLKEYHNELCSTLNLLGLSDKAITFQELLEEYDRKGLLGYVVSVYCLPNIMANSEETLDMDNLLSERLDPETVTSGTRNEYGEVIKRLLPLFLQKGYF